MGITTPWWMVVLLGIGIVFVGLGLLVLLCDGLRLVFSRKGTAAKAKAPVLAPAAPPPQIEDRKRLLAIASAAIAEFEGTDAPGFRIVSLKRRDEA